MQIQRVNKSVSLLIPASSVSQNGVQVGVRFRAAQGWQGCRESRVWKRLTALPPWLHDWVPPASSPPARQAHQPDVLHLHVQLGVHGVPAYRSSVPQTAVAQLIYETHMLVKHQKLPMFRNIRLCLLFLAQIISVSLPRTTSLRTRLPSRAKARQGKADWTLESCQPRYTQKLPRLAGGTARINRQANRTPTWLGGEYFAPQWEPPDSGP